MKFQAEELKKQGEKHMRYMKSLKDEVLEKIEAKKNAPGTSSTEQ